MQRIQYSDFCFLHAGIRQRIKRTSISFKLHYNDAFVLMGIMLLHFTVTCTSELKIDMNENGIIRYVDDCIDNLCQDFSKNPHKLLTEDDMRMHLCALLLRKFGIIQTTADGNNITSVPLHSEVRWYGNGRLKYRSDIVIVDVKTLYVRSAGSLRLPSKGYYFNVPKAIIELKFRRPKGPSERKFLESIQADCDKLSRLS